VSLTIHPIGRLRTPWKTTGECPRNGRRADPPPLCTVELDPEFVEGLHSIEGFSHLILLYWLDQSGVPEMVFKPPFDDQPRGVFATRTPRRPNPIGLSVVRFEGFAAPGVLNVRWLDCIDGTPLIDIKPYLVTTDCEPEATMGFQANRKR
jgi:tRNA-Thr(GGU) m(6)t(6)A37 methyltransferase TsaA